MGYENGPASFKTSFGSFLIMCVPSLYLPSKLFNLLTFEIQEGILLVSYFDHLQSPFCSHFGRKNDGKLG